MISEPAPRVALVGATGVVGNQLLELMVERGFTRGGVVLFASEAGASQTIERGGSEYVVRNLVTPEDLRDFDVALLAVPEGVAAPIRGARPGPKLVDLSAACRPPSGAPLVAPGLVTRDRLRELAGHEVFETPHPAAYAIALCLNALAADWAMVAATVILGASASGRERIAATVRQSIDLLNARLALEEGDTQRGFNLTVGGQERALRQALAAQVDMIAKPAPRLMMSVAGAPVLHGSAIAINCQGVGAREDWAQRLREAPGLLLVDSGAQLQIIDALGQEAILVQAEGAGAALSLWCVLDNTRLAALVALWVAENLCRGAGGNSP